MQKMCERHILKPHNQQDTRRLLIVANNNFSIHMTIAKWPHCGRMRIAAASYVSALYIGLPIFAQSPPSAATPYHDPHCHQKRDKYPPQQKHPEHSFSDPHSSLVLPILSVYVSPPSLLSAISACKFLQGGPTGSNTGNSSITYAVWEMRTKIRERSIKQHITSGVKFSWTTLYNTAKQVCSK